jgi:YjjG family noncanonical pyrimidine nucleotidase
MKSSFVFFDLDNTLLDHSSAEKTAQKTTYTTFPELQEVSLDLWLDTYRAVNHGLWEKYQRDEIDRHQLQIARFSDTMKSLNLDPERSGEIGTAYMEFYRNHWQWVAGARDALVHVSEKYRTGIITNGFKETQQLKIEQLQLNNYCSRFLISEDVGKMKPHPVVFDRATEMAGVPREQILYVGDSYTSDILGGKNAGWRTAWFTGLTTDNREENMADITFSRFDDLLDFLEL